MVRIVFQEEEQNKKAKNERKKSSMHAFMQSDGGYADINSDISFSSFMANSYEY